jgi:hypothetical protein
MQGPKGPIQSHNQQVKNNLLLKIASLPTHSSRAVVTKDVSLAMTIADMMFYTEQFDIGDLNPALIYYILYHFFQLKMKKFICLNYNISLSIGK